MEAGVQFRVVKRDMSKPHSPSGILDWNRTIRRMLMTQDPVCKMEIDETEAEFHSTYGGQKFHFCSEECKDTFDSQPERYAASAA
jgi:YHS domain-containing protein